MWSAPSLPSLPGSLLLEMAVSIRVSFMGKIDQFKNYSYWIGPVYIKITLEKQKIKKYVNMNAIS